MSLAFTAGYSDRLGVGEKEEERGGEGKGSLRVRLAAGLDLRHRGGTAMLGSGV